MLSAGRTEESVVLRFFFQCKVSLRLPAGAPPLCVIAVSRLSLCDVLLLLCLCMRASI